MGDIVITYVESMNEGLPCLVVTRKRSLGYYFGDGAGVDILNTIIGDRATELWNELLKKSEN